MALELLNQYTYKFDSKNREIKTITILSAFDNFKFNNYCDYVILRGIYVKNIDNQQIKIIINGQNILMIPINFLKSEKINDEKYYVDLNYEYFFEKPLKLIDPNTLMIEIKNNWFEILVENIYVKDRTKIEPMMIKQIYFYTITLNYYNEIVDVDFLCKGLFFDIEQKYIKRLKIEIRGIDGYYEYIDYYENLIQLYTKQINNMTYVNFTKNIDDFEPKDCISSVGDTRFKISIFTYVKTGNIKVYSINLNELLYNENGFLVQCYTK